MENLFDLIAGLPVHPLIDHFVVTLVPLFSLLQIAIVAKPKLKEKYFFITVGGLAVAFGASLIAKSSGESLSLRVGYPADHAQQGEALVAVVAALFGTSAFWYLFTEVIKSPIKIINSFIPLARISSAVLAIGAIGVTVIAGHSGAKAVWENRVASSSSTTAETNTQTSTKELTVVEVAKHNVPTDCWSVVNGKVYDLTQFVNKHPGGAKNIELMCGKDGTSAFTGQHGSSGRPNNELSNYLIGNLSGATTGLNQAPTGTSESEEENE